MERLRAALTWAPRVCLANRPRSIAARAGLVVPAGQRGPLGADRTAEKKGLDTLTEEGDISAGVNLENRLRISHHFSFLRLVLAGKMAFGCETFRRIRQFTPNSGKRV